MICSIVLMLSFAAAARAQQPASQAPAHSESGEDRARAVPGGASKGVKACHADIERWCRDEKPGEGRLGACLLPHRKELSKKCLRWASHGGKAHIDEALSRDLDGAPAEKKKP